METLVVTKTDFTFIPFTTFIISEIWINNKEEEQYCGEYILYMN